MNTSMRKMTCQACHWLTVTARTIGLILAMSPAVVHAEPTDGSATGPFPEVDFLHKYYASVKYDDYFTSSSGGVWFSTPLGLNCGIWDRGAFGCAGHIPGAPQGTTNVGWVSGQIRMRYDPGFAVLVPPGRAERDLPPRSYIVYNGTTCATMADRSTFCSRGPYKFYVTPTHTLLNPP
jgi:hypothetical protein